VLEWTEAAQQGGIAPRSRLGLARLDRRIWDDGRDLRVRIAILRRRSRGACRRGIYLGGIPPAGGLALVLRNTFALLVYLGESRHRRRVAKLGSLEVLASGLDRILRHALAVTVHQADIEHS
jgi:hypothetical protein